MIMKEKVDLRSDTLTKPSEAMRDAMARAEVGEISKQSQVPLAIFDGIIRSLSASSQDDDELGPGEPLNEQSLDRLNDTELRTLERLLPAADHRPHPGRDRRRSTLRRPGQQPYDSRSLRAHRLQDRVRDGPPRLRGRHDLAA